MEYENYIFDLYGTLVDINTNEETYGFWKKLAEIYSSYGANYSGTELKRKYKELIFKDTEKHKNIECYEPDILKIFDGLFKEKNVKASKELIYHTAITFRVLSRKYIKLYPGVKELLEILKEKNKKIYLLSNAQAAFTIPEIKSLGIFDFFDAIFISSEEGVKKPSARFMKRLIDTYSPDLKKTIMIGNDEKSDIMTAINAGMDSLYIHSNISPKEYGALNPTYKILDGDVTKIKDLIV